MRGVEYVENSNEKNQNPNGKIPDRIGRAACKGRPNKAEGGGR